MSDYIQSIYRVYEKTCYLGDNGSYYYKCAVKTKYKNIEIKLLSASEIKKYCERFKEPVPLHIKNITK